MKKLLLFALALLLAGSLALAEEQTVLARLICGDFVYVLQADGTACIAK